MPKETDEEFNQRLKLYQAKKRYKEELKKRRKSDKKKSPKGKYEIDFNSKSFKMVSIIIFSLVIITFIYKNLNFDNFDYQRPENGATQSFTNSREVANFKITTKTSDDYFIKLVGMNQQTIFTIYVYGYSTVNVYVPLGEYTLKYATGKTWQGYTNIFGNYTNFLKSKKKFLFYRTRNMITRNSIILYKKIGASSKNSKKINRYEF